jgi:O-antigen ligase
VSSPRRARLVVRAWLGIAVLSALLVTTAYFLPVPGRDVLLADGLRARGLFKDPNVFGPFLIPITVIVLEEWMRPRLLRPRPVLSGGLFLMLTIAVLLSASRAAWTALIVAVVVMLTVHAARRHGGRRAVRVLVLLCAVGFVATGVLAVSGDLTFLHERARLQAYDAQRFSSQHYGFELGWQYPFGVGPGQYTLYHELATHSTYIRTMAEQGLGGFIAWIGLVVATLALAVRNAVDGRDTQGIGSAALLGSWCGLALSSAVVDTLHWRHLWIVAAFIWAAPEREASQSMLVTSSLVARPVTRARRTDAAHISADR